MMEITKQTRDELENDFILAEALKIARQLNMSARGTEAVKGFVVTKLDSVKRRLLKYYGMKWYDLVHERTTISVAIREFVRTALIDGILDIVSEYSEIGDTNVASVSPNSFSEQVPAVSPDQQSLNDATKSNYMHNKKRLKPIQPGSGEFGEQQ